MRSIKSTDSDEDCRSSGLSSDVQSIADTVNANTTCLRILCGPPSIRVRSIRFIVCRVYESCREVGRIVKLHIGHHIEPHIRSHIGRASYLTPGRASGCGSGLISSSVSSSIPGRESGRYHPPLKSPLTSPESESNYTDTRLSPVGQRSHAARSTRVVSRSQRHSPCVAGREAAKSYVLLDSVKAFDKVFDKVDKVTVVWGV